MNDQHKPIGDEGRQSVLPLDDGAGPAHYITRAKADAMIMRALAEAGFDAPAAAPVSPPRKRRSTLAYWAAALLLAGASVGSASAAVLWYVRERSPEPVAAPATPKSERRATRRATRAPATPAPPTEPALEEPSLETFALPAPPPERPASRRAAEDWLVEGNRLRAEKRWSKADAAYTRAFREGKRSRTAYVARVASAAVRLEHLNDPRGALARYEAALRLDPDGPLTEEIHFGIAEAQRALGDRAAERRALELFLREHPRSPLAAQARARLD